MEYHVSKNGNDNFSGTKAEPFLTISKAAKVVEEGDRVIVHEGEYRECISPVNGGSCNAKRIVYEAAENERAVIKGSEKISEWENIKDNLWKVKIPNEIFGEYNPYAETIGGDWLIRPVDKPLHTGQVYINGVALREVTDINELTEMTWYCGVNNDTTVIYANFSNINPNDETAEINVRKSCFCPEKTGVNYITVRGFEFAQSATQWSPPTAEQTGMVSVNWSKGWIIEDNVMHDARCSAVCVGKERSTGHNLHTRYRRKPGYHTQFESVLAGRRIGWSKETIGSHIIRNNTIYDCGQNGIVGHMGGAFSEIYGNHIYNIATKQEFFGYEIAGIKLHAAIDTHIHHNRINNCTLGTWLDWEAQGTRVSSNLYYDNDVDIWIEVTHGPHLVDNNIFASKRNLKNAAQGGAYIHNLFCGSSRRYDVRNRSTPYHLPHSTDFMGTSPVYGGDDRFYQNIFVGGEETEPLAWQFGTEMYGGYTTSMEEFIAEAMKSPKCDVERYEGIGQPVYIDNNVYFANAKSFGREEDYVSSEINPKISIIEDSGNVYLEIDVPEGAMPKCTQIIDTESLEVPRMTEAPFENADGKNIALEYDYLGNKRNKIPSAGPIELKTGRQKIKIWG